MKMKKQCGKLTNKKYPRTNFISSNISLQQSAESHYNKQKLEVLDSWKQRIRWIKSIYSHKGSNKKGLRQQLLLASWRTWPKNIARLLVAPRKPSPSISRAGKPLAEKEADDADEGKSSELMLAQDSPPSPAPGYLPHTPEAAP